MHFSLSYEFSADAKKIHAEENIYEITMRYNIEN